MSAGGKTLNVSHLQYALTEHSEYLQEALESLLPKSVQTPLGEGRLAEAMRYAALSEGKRLRPFLVMVTANLFGVDRQSAVRAAVAIECIHAFSLVHDDLPALDNDDMRRGQPSCHKQFDEATAILAGDALLTLAFDILADEDTHHSPTVRVELVRACARACGIKGMIGGQMLDIMAEDHDLNVEETARLQRMKTGALFALSCEAGAILGRAPDQSRKALRGYAHDIGLAFQITDDLLDVTSDDNPDGSPRQDKSTGKGTYVKLMGKDQASLQAKMLVDQAIMHLGSFGSRAELLRDLAHYVISRQY